MARLGELVTSNCLSDLHSAASGFSQIAWLYDKNKTESFKKYLFHFILGLTLILAAPMGAVLDLLEDNLNDIVFDSIDIRIQAILQKNGFLKHFGFDHRVDSYNTTIQYQKMKPDDGRYFREYVTAQFLNRSELPR